MMQEQPKFPSKWLRVVIADDSRFVHLQEPVQHRTVLIELTPEQLKKLELRCTGNLGKTLLFEDISQIFFDNPAKEEAAHE